MIDYQLFYITVFAVINLISFLIILVDKNKSAMPGKERIPEGTMFFLAAALGALGVYLGMFLFHHKTRKWYFLIGIPLLILENIALVYLIYLFSMNKIVI